MVKYVVFAIITTIGFILAEYDKRRWYTPRDWEYFMILFFWWAVPVVYVIGALIGGILCVIKKILGVNDGMD